MLVCKTVLLYKYATFSVVLSLLLLLLLLRHTNTVIRTTGRVVKTNRELDTPTPIESESILTPSLLPPLSSV